MRNKLTMTVRGYKALVEPLATDLGGGFVAYAPALKGCVADGHDEANALANLADAIDCWIEAMTEARQPIPANRAYA